MSEKQLVSSNMKEESPDLPTSPSEQDSIENKDGEEPGVADAQPTNEEIGEIKHEELLMFQGQIKQGDIALTSDEALCLIGREWLSDTVIEFYLEYLRRVKFKDYSDQIEIIGPCVAQLLKNIEDTKDIAHQLEPLKLHERKIVLIPVNNELAGTEGTGSHWSLMFYLPDSKSFHHIDTLDPMNHDAAYEIAGQMDRGLGIQEDPENLDEYPDFVTYFAVQQSNNYDCGVHVLANADNAIRQIVVDDVDKDDFIQDKRINVRRERRTILDVILCLVWKRDNLDNNEHDTSYILQRLR